MSHNIKPGVATGDQVQEIFNYAKQKGFALPAVNVVGSSTINGVLETAAKLNAPVIIQFSNGGAQFNAGKGLSNENQKAAILGAVAGAKHIHTLAEAHGATVILHTDHCAKNLLPWIDGLLDASEKHFAETGKPLYSSHMIDLSEEPIEENLEISKKYLERMSKMGMTLEIELGITGGEEDGVDNSDVDSSKLYTQPDEVAYAYEELMKVSPRFTIAASFGNVHGVYKPGNVKLTPKILKNSQDYVQDKFGISKANAYYLISIANVIWDKLIDDPQMETILEPELLTAVRANRTEILPIQSKNEEVSNMLDFSAEEVISFINENDKMKIFNLVRIGQEKFYELIANKEISLGNGNILKLEDVKRDRAVFMQILKPFLPAKTTTEKQQKQLTRNDIETLKKNGETYWLNFTTAIRLQITNDAVNIEFNRRADDFVGWINKEILNNK